MAIYSVNHKAIGRSTHPAGTAAAHLKYVCRSTACTAVVGAHMPIPRPGRVARARHWMDQQEARDRKNARIIDKLTLALLREFDREASLALIRRFAQELTGGQAPWVCGVHDAGSDASNPHAHFVLRDRHHKTGKRVVGMSEKGFTERVRQLWEHVLNEALEEAGSDARVDHRSLKAQRAEKLLQADACTDARTTDLLREEAATLDRVPQGHEGATATRVEAQGIRSIKLARLRKMREDRAIHRAAARAAAGLDGDADPGPVEPPTMAETGKVLRDTFGSGATAADDGETLPAYEPEDTRTAQLSTARRVRRRGLALPETPKTRARAAWRDARAALRRGRVAAAASAAEAAAVVDRFTAVMRRLEWLRVMTPLRRTDRRGYKDYLARARVHYARDYRRAEDLWPWARHPDLRGTPDLEATRAAPLSYEDREIVDRWAYLKPPPAFAVWTRRFVDGARRKSRRVADNLPADVIVQATALADRPAPAPSLRQELAAAHRRRMEVRPVPEPRRVPPRPEPKPKPAPAPAPRPTLQPGTCRQDCGDTGRPAGRRAAPCPAPRTRRRPRRHRGDSLPGARPARGSGADAHARGRGGRRGGGCLRCCARPTRRRPGRPRPRPS